MKARRIDSRKGATLVEFALVMLLLFVVMFAAIELDRMVTVYAMISDAARAGVRYAIAHGTHRTGSGLDGTSGPGNTTQVQTIIKNYAGVLINNANVTITVTYSDSPDGSFTAGNPGSTVKIVVQYPYDPIVGLPLHVTLSAMSFGVIACCITST